MPLYNLPRLQRLLMPFYEKRGMTAHGYGELVWHYLVLNKKPHTNWEPPIAETLGVSNV